MVENKNIQWKRLTAEAVAIVLSILMAFAIDAWWDSRSERAAERSAIDRLIVEFEYNLAELGVSKKRHEGALAATEQLLALTGPERNGPHSDATAGKLLLDCFQNPTLEPRLGTVSSLIASGDLHLLRDTRLQGMLTEWPALAEDLVEWQIIERNHGEELILPFTFDFVAWPSILQASGHGELPSRFESDYDGLFSSMRFEGMLTNRRYNIRHLIVDIEGLEEKSREIVERLKNQ